MKKILVGILVAALILGVVIPLTFAGPGQRGKYAGTVKNIDYTAKKFDLIGEKNYTVVYTDETAFVKDGNNVKPEDLKNGEKVLVSGPLSDDGKTINAHLVAWGTLPGRGEGGKRPPAVKGIIEKLTLESKSFDLKAKDPNGNEVTFNVTYTDTTKFFRDLKPAKPEDFNNGEEVAVVGKINVDEKKIEALAVFYGKLPEPPGNRKPGRGFLGNAVWGEVSEINYSTKEFTLTPKGKDPVKVKYEDWTDFIKNGKFVFPEELKNGDNAGVFGPFNEETKTIQAHYVMWGKIQRGRGRRR